MQRKEWNPPKFIAAPYVPHCNLPCEFCYSWQNKNRIPAGHAPAIKRFLDQFIEYVELPFHIVFNGGEVLLDEELPGLVAHASGLGFEIGITTNGILLTPDKIRVLRDCGVKCFNLPLEGFTAETHDRLRRYPHGSHHVLVHRRIEEILDIYPDVVLEVNTVMNNQNHFEMPELIDWVTAHPGLFGLLINIIGPPLFRKIEPDWHEKEKLRPDGLWPADPEPFVETLQDLVEMKTAGYKIHNSVKLLQHYMNYIRAPRPMLHAECPTPETTLLLNGKLELRHCPTAPVPLGNILEQDLHEIIGSDQFHQHLDLIKQCRTNCHVINNCLYERLPDHAFDPPKNPDIETLRSHYKAKG